MVKTVSWWYFMQNKDYHYEHCSLPKSLMASHLLHPSRDTCHTCIMFFFQEYIRVLSRIPWVLWKENKKLLMQIKMCSVRKGNLSFWILQISIRTSWHPKWMVAEFNSKVSIIYKIQWLQTILWNFVKSVQTLFSVNHLVRSSTKNSYIEGTLKVRKRKKTGKEVVDGLPCEMWKHSGHAPCQIPWVCRK